MQADCESHLKTISKLQAACESHLKTIAELQVTLGSQRKIFYESMQDPSLLGYLKLSESPQYFFTYLKTYLAVNNGDRFYASYTCEGTRAHSNKALLLVYMRCTTNATEKASCAELLRHKGVADDDKTCLHITVHKNSFMLDCHHMGEEKRCREDVLGCEANGLNNLCSFGQDACAYNSKVAAIADGVGGSASKHPERPKELAKLLVATSIELGENFSFEALQNHITQQCQAFDDNDDSKFSESYLTQLLKRKKKKTLQRMHLHV